jgi:hypothetical protein
MSAPTLQLRRTDGGPDNAHAITPEISAGSQCDGVFGGFRPAQEGSAKTFELAERTNVLSSINEERNKNDQQG